MQALQAMARRRDCQKHASMHPGSPSWADVAPAAATAACSGSTVPPPSSRESGPRAAAGQ